MEEAGGCHLIHVLFLTLFSVHILSVPMVFLQVTCVNLFGCGGGGASEVCRQKCRWFSSQVQIQSNLEGNRVRVKLTAQILNGTVGFVCAPSGIIVNKRS